MRGQRDGTFERWIIQGCELGPTAAKRVAHHSAARRVKAPKEFRAFTDILRL